jgi:hypothetical protein
MSYLTVEVEIDHGKLVAKEPNKLPETGKGVLTVLLPGNPASSFVRKRVHLPLVQGDGSHKINPTPEQLDASLWD